MSNIQEQLLGLTVHVFDSTGSAYGACQWDKRIKTGDILLIPSEQVIGLADTWPVAFTAGSGKLHTFSGAYEGPFTVEQRTNAVLLATALGYPL